LSLQKHILLHLQPQPYCIILLVSRTTTAVIFSLLPLDFFLFLAPGVFALFFQLLQEELRIAIGNLLELKLLLL